ERRNLREPFDLPGLGHNSADYIHVVIEAMKLAFADREGHYGDPRQVKVPEGLLDPAYTAARRGLLDLQRAWSEMPPPGDPATGQATVAAWTAPPERAGPGASSLRTSYTAVVAQPSTAFSAPPSDVSTDTPITPGTGLAVSSRGSQSWLVPEHPSAVAPGKRPRLTPSPAMVLRDGRFPMPIGTPGGDVQAQ